MADRRQIIALVAAGVVVIAVTAVVFVVGVIPLPDFPSLAADPDPEIPGVVAFFRPGDEGPCLSTVPASGGAELEVLCEPGLDDYSGPEWTAEGLLVAWAFEERGPLVVVIDPESGRELDRFATRRGPEEYKEYLPDRAQRADDAQLVTRSPERGEVVLEVRRSSGDFQELLRAKGPLDYDFLDLQFSPDGEWVLARDSEERLIVLGASGSPGPRVLVEEVVSAAWFIPGNDTYTVDPAELGSD